MTAVDVYGEQGQPIAHAKDGWFNIACADDALAKIRLYGMDIEDRSKGDSRLHPAGPARYAVTIGPFTEVRGGQYSEEGHRAALNMMAANYCGTARHYTRHGIKIGWPEKFSLPTSDLPKCSNEEHVEALWGVNGAVCVCQSRLWLSDMLIPSNRIPGSCQDGKCDERTFMNNARKCPTREIPWCGDLPAVHEKVYWESDVQDHLHKVQ